MENLNKIGVNTENALTPISDVVCILKSGAQIKITTPLSPEDVMVIWNSKKSIIKLPVRDHSYTAIRKRSVDFIHTFISSEPQDETPAPETNVAPENQDQ